MLDYKDKIERRQIFLGGTFVISSIVFILLLVLYAYFWFRAESQGTLAAIEIGALPVLVLLVSVSSLIGFVLNSVLSIRKERRETQTFKLELEKKALEIEQLRMELGKARGQYATALPDQAQANQ